MVLLGNERTGSGLLPSIGKADQKDVVTGLLVFRKERAQAKNIHPCQTVERAGRFLVWLTGKMKAQADPGVFRGDFFVCGGRIQGRGFVEDPGSQFDKLRGHDQGLARLVDDVSYECVHH